MNTALWIVQGLLAFAFLAAGLMKVLTPKEKLQDSMAWVEDFEPEQIRGIGMLEVLGAIGVILPPVVGIAVFLSPVAATALGGVMLAAAMTHWRRGERLPELAINAVLFSMAAFVAVGRFIIEPF